MFSQSRRSLFVVIIIGLFLVPSIGRAEHQIYLTVQSPTPSANDRFGAAVAFVGDLDSPPDGIHEFLVGAPGPAGGDGRAFLFSAKEDPLNPGFAELFAVIPTAENPSGTAGERFGFAVAGVPDMNGDFRPDFLIGAPSALDPTPPHNSPQYLIGRFLAACLLTIREGVG